MTKRIKKLTRQQKIQLSKLNEDFRSANEIGTDIDTLESLTAHGLARSILDVGEARFRITQKGRGFVSSHAEAG